jgi:SAM-dependent methyltransferase
LGLVEHFKGYAEEVIKRLNPPRESLVVDIGSNTGNLLKFFKGFDMRVVGIDPARKIAEKATLEGIETIPDFFNLSLAEKIRREYGPATIITANNVFAHADDMSGMAQGISRLLASDGVFIFEASYLVDKINKYLFDLIYHEHLSYHSVKPLISFFNRHGMELFDVKRNSSKGGTIRGFAQKTAGPRKISKSIQELLLVEEKLGVERPETFKAFAFKIEGLKQQLQALLKDLKAKNKTIAGYGASATTTTLLYHFGLNDFLKFIVDDYPAKQNLYSPGRHIPILAPQVIYEQYPDYIVILAWRYSEPIIKKHSAYLDQGGHFIIPLPEIKVV